MDRQIVVMQSDKRQEKLASLFCGEKRIGSWERYQAEERTGTCIYVLPIPVSKLDTDLVLKEQLKAAFRKADAANCVVFGGAFHQEWKTFFEEHQIRYWDFMQLPEVVEGNAWITAEAVVAETILHGERSIQQQKVLLTGYGCCGQKIAALFSKLGANVFVAARREEIRVQARKDGYGALDFHEVMDVISEMDMVINTVPALVVTEDWICRMSKDAWILDIASKPGGTDFEAAKRQEIKAKLALGLPGLYTTTSSAQLLKDAIVKYAPLEKDIKEESLWIFQIVI